MRKIFKKSLACMLALMLCLATVAGCLTVGAENVTGTDGSSYSFGFYNDADKELTNVCPGQTRVRAHIQGIGVAVGVSEGITLTIPEDFSISSISAVGADTTINDWYYSQEDGILTVYAKTKAEGTHAIAVYLDVADTAEAKSYSFEVTVESASNSNDLICEGTLTADLAVAAEHKAATDAAVEPTCVATGLTEGSHCAYCGEVLVAQEEVPATGVHKPVYTDNEDGTHTVTCETCETYSELKDCTYDEETGLCVCGAAEEVETCEHTNKTFVEITKVATVEESGTIVFHCADCNEDVSYEVTYKSDLITFVTPAISCEATTILRLKTVKTTGLSAYTNGLLVTTHNYQNGAAATTNSYNMSDLPVVSSRYQLDIPVIYTQFTDTFDCALYLEQDGVWYFNGGTSYSLKDVAMTYVNSSTTEDKYKYTAANLLKVGAAAQTEFSYATTNLADSELDGCAYVEDEVPTISCETGVNFTGVPTDYQTAGKVFYVTPGVLLSDSTAITIKANKAYYSGDELNNLRMEYSYIKENGATKTGEITEFTTDSKGRLLFTLAVDAPDMRSVITFKLYNGTTQVADDAVFSIEGSLASYYNSGSYTSVIERAMIYSDVVAMYF